MSGAIVLCGFLCGLPGVAQPNIDPGQISTLVAQTDSELETRVRQLEEEGKAYLLAEEFQLAIASFQEALAIRQQQGDRSATLLSLTGLGDAYVGLSDYPQAINAYEESLAVIRELGIPFWEISALINLGQVALASGDATEALRYAQQGLSMAGQTEDTLSQSKALYLIGSAQSALGNSAEAIAAYEQSLLIAQELEELELEANVLLGLSNVYESRGNYQEAIVYSEQILPLAREDGRPLSQVVPLTTLANLHRYMGDYPQALSYYKQALATAQTSTSPIARRFQAYTLVGLGSAYASQGSITEGILLIEQAIPIVAELNNSEIEANLKNARNIVQSLLGNYSEALVGYYQILTSAENTEDMSLRASTLEGIGAIHLLQGKFPEALGYFNRALAIAQELGDRIGEANILGDIGEVYLYLSDYPQARRYQEKSLELARELGSEQLEAEALTYLGTALASEGDYGAALDSLEQSLAILEQVGSQFTKAEALLAISNVHLVAGDYSRALGYREQMLEFAYDTGIDLAKAIALGEMGQFYSRLGSYDQALDYFEQSLSIMRSTGTQLAESELLAEAGGIYEKTGRYEKAASSYQQSLVISRKIGSTELEAVALHGLGSIEHKLGQYDQAFVYQTESLELMRSIGNRTGEGRGLISLGGLARDRQQTAAALEYTQQGLAIAKETGDRPNSALALSTIGDIFAQQNQPELAIVFLKQAINQYELVRTDNRLLDDELQSTYTDTVANTYRTLADLLLQQNRILEAQRVLDLLKVQEIQDYLSTVRGNATTASGIDFYQPEQLILEQYNNLQSSAIDIGRQLAQLNEKELTSSLTAEEDAQRAELYSLEKSIRQQFVDFAQSPEIETFLSQIANTEDTLSLDSLDSLRDNLETINAALIYPLILDDRIELVITTPDSPPLRRTVENVSRSELNAAILTFRSALQDPSSDAKTPAYQLYRWLIEPLEADLANAGIDTILYAPDGPLRYVPLAALYDAPSSSQQNEGQWLAERFQVNNITATSIQELDTQPFTEPRVLAGAFADTQLSYSVPVGEQTATFSGLPFAGVEVAALADTLPNTSTYTDESFSLKAIEPRLNNFNIVHFATHAALVPDDAGDSFILFGNGDRPTLRDIKSWSLRDVDLVVLSACETGLGGFDNNGEQILGLGYQFQAAGARAVISSLWQVDDGGTQILMNAFYLALQNGYSKTEALQRAQQAVIEGDLSPTGDSRGASLYVIDTGTGEPIDVKGSIDHPYYWAPFILIGNGL
ncbi:MAG: tetratricopeptide repeat protein [Cyanobacteria bacterium P01_D01_bin.1]